MLIKLKKNSILILIIKNLNFNSTEFLNLIKGDLAAKCDVNGKNAHPLWAWMKKQKNGKESGFTILRIS